MQIVILSGVEGSIEIMNFRLNRFLGHARNNKLLAFGRDAAVRWGVDRPVLSPLRGLGECGTPFPGAYAARLTTFRAFGSEHTPTRFFFAPSLVVKDRLAALYGRVDQQEGQQPSFLGVLYHGFDKNQTVSGF